MTLPPPDLEFCRQMLNLFQLEQQAPEFQHLPLWEGDWMVALAFLKHYCHNSEWRWRSLDSCRRYTRDYVQNSVNRLKSCRDRRQKLLILIELTDNRSKPQLSVLWNFSR